MENGEIPENANEREFRSWLIALLQLFEVPEIPLFFCSVFLFCLFLFCYFLDCPGPQSESAGKSDDCQGCPNQEACATAPKGPDPGLYFLSFFFSLQCVHVLFIASQEFWLFMVILDSKVLQIYIAILCFISFKLSFSFGWI